jgi:hypothetical protein
MNVLDYLQTFWSTFLELGTLVGWIASQLAKLLSIFVMPVNFFYNFLKAFLSSATQTPTGVTILPEGVANVFTSIPYWTTITTFITVALYALALFFVLDQIKKI